MDSWNKAPTQWVDAKLEHWATLTLPDYLAKTFNKVYKIMICNSVMQ